MSKHGMPVNAARSALELNQKVADVMQMAIETTFQKMFCTPIHFRPAEIGRGSLATEFHIAGILDMRHPDKPHSVFIIAFSLDAANKVMEACDMQNLENVMPVDDVIAEITNVIYGQVKKSLNGMGYCFDMNMPKTVQNSRLFFERNPECERIVLPFSINGGRCYAAIVKEN